MRAAPQDRRIVAVRWALYVALAVFVVTEKWGEATSDTRLDLVAAPGRWLHDAFWLWNPRVSLGEMQNQAYGYLFPQGPFFALGEWARVPGWVVERGWSVLLLVVACEGLRRLARAVGAGEVAATLAGFAYGLTPRLVAELGVRSAEILPGVVLPWALLPLVYVLQRRLAPWRGALFSAAIFTCCGGVNGTATAAPAGLLIVVVLWAWATRRVGWRFVAGWGALMGAVNLWWVLALMRLGAYSPPFFDYVEDARATTDTAGFSAGLRGASNWVDYIVVAGFRWWPAGYEVSFSPVLVLASGSIAALGVLGLVRHRGEFRVPLLIGLVFGLVCVSIAHVGPFGSPLSPWLRDLLDGALAPLRNVPKADPIMRVPLTLGLAFAVDQMLAVRDTTRGTTRDTTRGTTRGGIRDRVRTALGPALVGVVVLALAAMSWPVLTGHLRTPGWSSLPSYWTEASDYLDAAPDDAGAVWVVPGSGFGIQQWGWTMEEPMQVLGQTRWITRSQVPLTPAPTIRMLTVLEGYLETGAGSPYLSRMLRRVGIDRILLRHDLDVAPAQGIDSGLVARALARSPGITRVRTFGRLAFGPAIEVYDVGRATSGYRARSAARLVSVASSVEDVVAAVGAGLVGDDEPVAVPGEPGWRAAGLERPADVQGDGYRLRERNFGRVHDAESNVMAPGDPYRGGRVLPNYPGPPGARPVTAHYTALSGVEATSSNGYADVLGPVRPETAPWAALDGDDSTYWLSAPYLSSAGQGIDLTFATPPALGTVTITQPGGVVGLQVVPRWRITAGDLSVLATTDPITGVATASLRGVRAGSLSIRAVGADASEQVGIAEIAMSGVSPSRSLVLPSVDLAARPEFVFTAVPETRACNATLLGPDCSAGRQRPSEEATGIDRTITVPQAGSWQLTGTVVARSSAGTAQLLRPLAGVQVDASSWWGQDPAVSPRMVNDGETTTSWIADPRDPAPTLTFDLGRRRTLDGLRVLAPADDAARPASAVVSGGGQTRRVRLSSVTRAGTVRFAPLTARRVTVRFAATAAQGDTRPVGASEVRLRGGHVVVALDGAAPTGAVCGLGPTLVIDGRRYPTKVSGLIGAIIGDDRLSLAPCHGDRTVRLSAGTHRIAVESTQQFQPVALELRQSSGLDLPSGSDRAVQVTSRGRTSVTLQVGAGGAAILSAPQSFNEGWQATLVGTDGEKDQILQPVQADGWAQGWVLPAGSAGEVRLEFAPQSGYLFWLIVGLVLVGLAILAALVVAVRTRLAPAPEPAEPAPPRRWGRRARLIAVLATTLAAGGLGLLIGGPFVGLAAACGVPAARGRRTRLLGLIVAAGLLAAGVVVVTALVIDHPQRPDALADLLTGCGVAVAVTLGALGPGRPTRP